MMEEWNEKNKGRLITDLPSSSGSHKKDGGRYVCKDKSGTRGGGDMRDSGGRLTSMGTPRHKGRCNKCKMYWHFARECKTMGKEEKQDAAHHVVGDVETGALLVAQVCMVMKASPRAAQGVFLNQERVLPSTYGEGAWILDIGATNHMTGRCEALASLDESVRGAVRFGDGSTVEIRGIESVALAGRNDEHRVLTEVYYIPLLKCNIVSLGQLEEAGCCVDVEAGILKVFER